MAKQTAFSVRGESGLIISVELPHTDGQEAIPLCKLVDSDGWLRATIDASLGPLQALLGAYIMVIDLHAFREELATMVSGESVTASFQATERALWFQLITDSLGRVTVSGGIANIDMPGNILQFEFDSDLSFMQQTLAQLDRLDFGPQPCR